MGKRLSKATRTKVAERAEFKCEYCMMQEEFLFLSFEIDHIISIKHGGGNEFENLAYTCSHCNQHKGSDLTTFLGSYQNIVPLFNPRLQVWEEHFYAEKGILFSKTDIGKATIKLLQMNNPDRVEVREFFQQLGIYP